MSVVRARRCNLRSSQHLHQKVHHVGVAKDRLEKQLSDQAVAESLKGGGCHEDVIEAGRAVDPHEADDFVESTVSLLLEAFDEEQGVQPSHS